MRNLGVALAVLLALRLLVGARQRFFFARGDLGAWLIHLLPDLVIFATCALFWRLG